MAKSRCPKCRRKMVVETEENEQCTSETCTYFIQYPTDGELRDMSMLIPSDWFTNNMDPRRIRNEH